MKPAVRTLLVILRDSAIILGLLVWLARSDQMPQLVPPQVTDFLVDASDLVFGSKGGGLGAAATDLADLALYGETDKNARTSLELFRLRVENWFSRILDNVAGIATHPLIRKALPDFGQTFSILFAADYLQNMVDRFSDIDEVILFGQAGVILRTSREGCLPLQPETIPQSVFERARVSYSAELVPLPGQRFLALASFFSPLREQQGYLLVILNSRALKKILSEYSTTSGSTLYLSTTEQDSLIQAGQDRVRVGTTALQHERFIDTAAGRKRNLALPIRLKGRESQLTVGILSPLVNPDALILFGARLVLFVVTLLVAVWLVRRLVSGITCLVRTHGLKGRLLLHALNASRGQGKRIVEGVERMITTRSAAHYPVKQAEPSKESPPAKQSEEALPDFVPSIEPDVRRLEQIQLERSYPVQEGEFVIIDGPVELDPGLGIEGRLDFDPAEPAPIDD